jgi:hypothetical protein
MITRRHNQPNDDNILIVGGIKIVLLPQFDQFNGRVVVQNQEGRK